MRRGRRSSAPPAATSERLASGMPILAPLAATIRSQARAISIPPATAKPSTAAISGLRDARWALPAKPRAPNQGDSPLTNAPRSMPALKNPPVPVSTPTDRSSSSSSWSSAPATPAASAALTAFRTSGLFSVISRTLPRVSARTGSAVTVLASVATAAGYLNRRGRRIQARGGAPPGGGRARAAQGGGGERPATSAARAPHGGPLVAGAGAGGCTAGGPVDGHSARARARAHPPARHGARADGARERGQRLLA